MITASIAGSRMKVRRRFGFLLKDVTRLYVQRFEQHAAALGLTLAQCKALMRLADCEGVSQVRLAELTDLEPDGVGAHSGSDGIRRLARAA